MAHGRKISVGTTVKVINPDSMYRGERGTVVPLDARRSAALDNFNRQRARNGATLVERSNGSLFVIDPSELASYRTSRAGEAPRIVADFSTLPELIKHARATDGATHTSGTGPGTLIFFPRGDGAYDQATVWRKEDYWHAQGPSARTRVSRLPSGAKPIPAHAGRWAAEAGGRDKRRDKYVYVDDLRPGDVIFSDIGEATVIAVSDPDQKGYRNVTADVNGGRETFRYYGESTVPTKRRIAARGATEAAGRRRGSDSGRAAKAAGAKYAGDQLASDYFADWIREELSAAGRMDPKDVIALDSKQDARRVAKNMLQQMEWDTKRQLRDAEIEDLAGGKGQHVIDSFLEGFDGHLHDPDVINWLADELMEIEGELKKPARKEKRVGAPNVRRADESTVRESGVYIIETEYPPGSGSYARYFVDQSWHTRAEAERYADRWVSKNTKWRVVRNEKARSKMRRAAP